MSTLQVVVARKVAISPRCCSKRTPPRAARHNGRSMAVLADNSRTKPGLCAGREALHAHGLTPVSRIRDQVPPPLEAGPSRRQTPPYSPAPPPPYLPSAT